MTSCFGPKRIDKWVAKHYNNEIPPATKKKVDNIAITTDLKAKNDRISNSVAKENKMLPLLFYWQWHYDFAATLNPKIPFNNFTSTVVSYSNKSLKQKLIGKRIELTVNNVPHIFDIEEQGWMVWVIFGHFGKDVMTIQPESRNLVVTYRLLKDDNKEIKSGVITIQNPNKDVELKMFQSLKKKTAKHLDDYDANMTAMSKMFVDQLVTELE